MMGFAVGRKGPPLRRKGLIKEGADEGYKTGAWARLTPTTLHGRNWASATRLISINIITNAAPVADVVDDITGRR